jgi:hypothetical protein
MRRLTCWACWREAGVAGVFVEVAELVGVVFNLTSKDAEIPL